MAGGRTSAVITRPGAAHGRHGMGQPSPASGSSRRLVRMSARGTRVDLGVAVTAAVIATLLAALNGAEPTPGYERNVLAARLFLAVGAALAAATASYSLRTATRAQLVVMAGWTTYLGTWLAGTWPGLLMSDSVNVVLNSRTFIVYEWFSYLHSVLYVAVLDLAPHAAVLGVLQVLLTAGVLTASTQLLRDLGAGWRWLAVLGAVLALAGPLLVNTLLQSRDTIFGLLHVYLAVRVAQCVRRRSLTPRDVAVVAALTSWLSVYRGDGIVLLAVVPAVLLLAVRPGRRTALAVVGATAAGAVVLHVLLPAAFVIRPYPHAYELSLRLNPLGEVLQSNFRSEDRARDLADLSRVIDVRGVQELSTPLEIPAFWAGKWRPDANAADFAAFSAAADRLMLANAGTVLEGRVKTWASASAVRPGGFLVPPGLEQEDRYSWIEDRTALTGEPVAPPLYEAQAAYLRWTAQGSGEGWAPGSVMWNLVPWLLVLVLALSLLRTHRISAVVAAIVLCRVPLVFLAAPAAQHKYYYSVFLGGVLVGGLLVVETLVKRRGPAAVVASS